MGLRRFVSQKKTLLLTLLAAFLTYHSFVLMTSRRDYERRRSRRVQGEEQPKWFDQEEQEETKHTKQKQRSQGWTDEEGEGQEQDFFDYMERPSNKQKDKHSFFDNDEYESQPHASPSKHKTSSSHDTDDDSPWGINFDNEESFPKSQKSVHSLGHSKVDTSKYRGFDNTLDDDAGYDDDDSYDEPPPPQKSQKSRVNKYHGFDHIMDHEPETDVFEQSSEEDPEPVLDRDSLIKQMYPHRTGSKKVSNVDQNNAYSDSEDDEELSQTAKRYKHPKSIGGALTFGRDSDQDDDSNNYEEEFTGNSKKSNKLDWLDKSDEKFLKQNPIERDEEEEQEPEIVDMKSSFRHPKHPMETQEEEFQRTAAESNQPLPSPIIGNRGHGQRLHQGIAPDAAPLSAKYSSNMMAGPSALMGQRKGMRAQPPRQQTQEAADENYDYSLAGPDQSQNVGVPNRRKQPIGLNAYAARQSEVEDNNFIPVQQQQQRNLGNAYGARGGARARAMPRQPYETYSLGGTDTRIKHVPPISQLFPKDHAIHQQNIQQLPSQNTYINRPQGARSSYDVNLRQTHQNYRVAQPAEYEDMPDISRGHRQSMAGAPHFQAAHALSELPTRSRQVYRDLGAPQNGGYLQKVVRL